MRRLDILNRAGRSLRQAKIRTLLTSLAIGVGAFTITVSLAAGAGSRDYADKLISSNVDPQSLFIAKDEALFGGGTASTGLNLYDPDVTNTQGTPIIQLTQDDIKKLEAIKSIENVQPLYQVSIQYVTFEGNSKKFTSDIATYGAGIISDTAAGTLPARGTQIGDGDIVMPAAFLSTLEVGNAVDMIGKTVTLTLQRPSTQVTTEQITEAFTTGGFAAVQELTKPITQDFTYKVVAVTQQSATTLAASSSLMVSASQSKVLSEFLTKGTSNYQKYAAVTALAKDGVKPADAKADIEAAGFTARTAQDLQSLIFSVVNILQGIVLGFGIIALIASVFGIINTQYISVLERTQQIGLMKALGMSGRDVSKLFRYEAAWIGFLGGAIGAGIAVVAGILLNPVITKALSLGEGNNLLIFEPIPIAVMIVALVVIAIVAGYFPARKAAKLDPIEALRTE